jgi:hypothetical protein
MIGRMLRDECYIGNLIYNRRSGKLGRSVSITRPLCGLDARDALSQFSRETSSCERTKSSMNAATAPERLRITLMKRGKLSPKIIDETAYLFSVTIVAEAFPFSRAASFRTRGAQEFSASE